MPVQKSLSTFRDGFVVDIFCDTSSTEKVVISQYELSRNNVRGKDVKAVKATNLDGTGTSTTNIESECDYALIPSTHYGVIPFYIGNGDLTITLYIPTPARRRFVFYYDVQPSVMIDLVP